MAVYKINLKKRIKEDFSGDPKDKEFSTDQAKLLDELTYLISTEYEAIKWYDEAIPKINASGIDPELAESTIQGIEEIRKDEEDHVAHLERLVKQIKLNKLIPGTNGD